MKIALCFIINYEHILNKEHIWKEWIEYNKDIINVYFYYKDLTQIKSSWILEHVIPPNYIYETSYYHVIPAYMSLMRFAMIDLSNQWFCFLTDSCCPIISPKRFRYLFYNYYNYSIISWKKPWWNIQFHKRSNLALLSEELRLGNDPWFVFKRENVTHCLYFLNNQQRLTTTICNGGLANESLFAIILQFYKQLTNVINCSIHITDWTRQSSPTSPYIFKRANKLDIDFIEKNINDNKFAMFIRKVSKEFPDDVLKNYIYNYSKERDDKLKEPFIFIYRRLYEKFKIYKNLWYYMLFSAILYIYLMK